VLKLAGDVGFVLAGTGAFAFALLFFICVRWWSDLLGRILAGAIGSIAFIMVLSMVRLIGLPLPGLFWWRAFLFNALGLVLWAGAGAFVWTQFFASSRRAKKARENEASRSGAKDESS